MDSDYCCAIGIGPYRVCNNQAQACAALFAPDLNYWKFAGGADLGSLRQFAIDLKLQ
jgi:hypothetical protein